MNFKKIAEEVVSWYFTRWPNGSLTLRGEQNTTCFSTRQKTANDLISEVESSLRQAWLEGARKMQERAVENTFLFNELVKETIELINPETLMEEE